MGSGKYRSRLKRRLVYPIKAFPKIFQKDARLVLASFFIFSLARTGFVIIFTGMKITYIVICDEIGYPKWDPYLVTEDKEHAENVCRIVSKKYSSRSFVECANKRIFMSCHSGYNKFDRMKIFKKYS